MVYQYKSGCSCSNVIECLEYGKGLLKLCESDSKINRKYKWVYTVYRSGGSRISQRAQTPKAAPTYSLTNGRGAGARPLHLLAPSMCWHEDIFLLKFAWCVWTDPTYLGPDHGCVYWTRPTSPSPGLSLQLPTQCKPGWQHGLSCLGAKSPCPYIMNNHYFFSI